MHYAVKHEQPSMIQNLLDHGADWRIKDNSGLTALDYARELKRFDICELMGKYKSLDNPQKTQTTAGEPQ